MELPEIGKQCSQLNCKQLDFLPLKCLKCCQEFCSEHFNQHSITNCTNIEHKQIEFKTGNTRNLYECSLPDCKTRNIVPILCPNCKQNFCIKHRHTVECSEDKPEIKAQKILKLNEPIEKFNQAKAEVDKQIEKQLNKARNTKKIELATKIQLMKIKTKATGLQTIPTNDRVYFNIAFNQQQINKAIFVSKSWTIGRVIDAIAVECKLTNNNNKLNEKKLRLFRMDGQILTKIMSDHLEVLLNEQITYNGDSLVIDYIDCE